MLARVLRPLTASRAAARLVSTVPSSAEPNSEALFTSEHRAMQESLQKVSPCPVTCDVELFRESKFTSLQLIDSEINPHVDKWEADKSFPAHDVFKKLGSAGFLGVNKPAGKLACFSDLSMRKLLRLGSVRPQSDSVWSGDSGIGLQFHCDVMCADLEILTPFTRNACYEVYNVMRYVKSYVTDFASHVARYDNNLVKFWASV